jgi:NDP-sugar pyrophosphorylase family protein
LSGHGLLPPICVLAGGRGTRLGERVRQTPKPLLQVAGEPFLIHQIRLLAAHGAGDVVLCVGYLGERIEARIGAQRFGVHISYSYDSSELDGTLGAIRRAAPRLGERFLVLYGDTYLRIDYRASALAWMRSGFPAMMAVLRNEGRWEPSNACFDGTRVTAYDKLNPSPRMRWIDYGLGGLTAVALAGASPGAREVSELYRDLAVRGELFGFEATERFYEIGTPAALADTDAFLCSLRETASRQ